MLEPITQSISCGLFDALFAVVQRQRFAPEFACAATLIHVSPLPRTKRPPATCQGRTEITDVILGGWLVLVNQAMNSTTLSVSAAFPSLRSVVFALTVMPFAGME